MKENSILLTVANYLGIEETDAISFPRSGEMVIQIQHTDFAVKIYVGHFDRCNVAPYVGNVLILS